MHDSSRRVYMSRGQKCTEVRIKMIKKKEKEKRSITSSPIHRNNSKVQVSWSVFRKQSIPGFPHTKQDTNSIHILSIFCLYLLL